MQDWRTWDLQNQLEQEHSGCVEGDLTAFEEDGIAVVRSGLNKRCANGASPWDAC